MIIKNIGSKIINIGTEILMPDSQITVSKDVAALPAIQAFAAKKLVSAASSALRPRAVRRADKR